VRGQKPPLDAVLMGYGGHLQALLPGFLARPSILGNGGQSYKESIYDLNIVRGSVLVIAAVRFNNKVNLDCKKTVFTDNI